MGTEPHAPQHVGPQMAVAIARPISRQRVVAIAGRHVAVEAYDVRRAEDVDEACRSLSGHVEGLVVFQEGLLWTHRRQIVATARAERLPTIFGYRDAAEIGGLMSYGPDLVDLFRRGAGYVDKIIKGTQPSDLPIQLPTKFELIINLKTATALELAIPPALLVRADHTIE